MQFVVVLRNKFTDEGYETEISADSEAEALECAREEVCANYQSSDSDEWEQVSIRVRVLSEEI